jgi:glycosyltransferase involved in cell wall biosynthesis
MGEILSFCDIALLTSAYEGFPMFIKEAMAHGCIPVATALPGNRMHLASNENSLLIEAVADENSVVIEGLEYIKALLRDRALCQKLSHEAYRYAAAHFTRDIFNMKYRELLLSR